jgi:hypothetical protein
MNGEASRESKGGPASKIEKGEQNIFLGQDLSSRSNQKHPPL